MSSHVTYEVKTEKLGLAAYIKMNGAVLEEVRGSHFIFRSERPLNAWAIEYENSCCKEHDANVCSLRKLR